MIAIIIIGVVILLPLIYLSRLKGEYEVTRSILIQKKAKVIFAKICDFKTWNEWKSTSLQKFSYWLNKNKQPIAIPAPSPAFKLVSAVAGGCDR